MPLWVYALISSPHPPLGRGAFDEPLRAVRGGRLGAVVGTVRSRPVVSATRLRAHDRTVRRLFARHDPLLPARFGTLFDDDDDVAEMLRQRSPALRAALSSVAGGEQMSLRIFSEKTLAASPASRRGGPGTRFLAGRRAAASPPRALAPLLETLSPFVLQTRVERHEVPPLRATVHHLVAREKLPPYLAALEAASLPAGITVRRSGPHHPWAFAEIA